jgi:hypothetical protein
MNEDRQLEQTLDRLSGSVDRSGVWASIEAQAAARAGGGKQPSAPRRRSGRRVAVFASIAAFLVAAITVGSLEAVRHLGNGHPILVITDQTTVPSTPATQPVTTTTQPVTSTTQPVTSTTQPVTTTTQAVTTTTGLTTTTEKLSTAETRLSNGHIKAMGYIDKVYEKDGKRYISIDYAEYLTGAAADAAAVAAGEIAPGEHVPDDYWIQNDNPQKRVFEVSDSVAITTSSWISTFAWNEIMDHPVTWAQFKSFWSATPPADDIHLHRSPWWIERDGPLVVKID